MGLAAFALSLALVHAEVLDFESASVRRVVALVAVEGDPLTNLAARKDVLLVVSDGKVVLDRLRQTPGLE